MSDCKAPFTVRICKLLTNPLLQRRQMYVDLLHLGRANVSRVELQQRLTQQFKVQDPRCIIVGNLSTAFGGGRSRGQAWIYDDFKAVQRFEHKYRLVRAGLLEAQPKKGRRGVKELKNRRKKLRGTEKAKAAGGKK
ncbi:40S ribosomal protein S24-1 [Cyclospora cayetanensis]|uniref:40S ribosomal protein S24-1 n=1 Tax=Cyclospora cayetanensis TaxID=88456 RepID=A0A6P5WEP6_9EIME|nr:40S ribosomal protein S24-1 [Cyclospora cayetanensis]